MNNYHYYSQLTEKRIEPDLFFPHHLFLSTTVDRNTGGEQEKKMNVPKT